MPMTFFFLVAWFMFLLPILYSWPMKNFWIELNLVHCYKLWYLPDFIKVHEPFERRPPLMPLGFWRGIYGFMCKTVWNLALSHGLNSDSSRSSKWAQTSSRGKVKLYWNSLELGPNSSLKTWPLVSCHCLIIDTEQIHPVWLLWR